MSWPWDLWRFSFPLSAQGEQAKRVKRVRITLPEYMRMGREHSLLQVLHYFALADLGLGTIFSARVDVWTSTENPWSPRRFEVRCCWDIWLSKTRLVKLWQKVISLPGDPARKFCEKGGFSDFGLGIYTYTIYICIHISIIIIVIIIILLLYIIYYILYYYYYILLL